MTGYITKDGDMIDLICLRYYGKTARYTEAVLEANPGLSDLDPFLPSGIVINLPELPELESQSSGIRLWD